MIRLHSWMMLAACSVFTCLVGCSSPRPIEAIRTSGDNFFKAGDFEAARDEYAEILSHDPSDWEANYQLGLSCLKLGKPHDLSTARRSLEIVSTLKPHNQDVANAFAEVMFQQ